MAKCDSLCTSAADTLPWAHRDSNFVAKLLGCAASTALGSSCPASTSSTSFFHPLNLLAEGIAGNPFARSFFKVMSNVLFQGNEQCPFSRDFLLQGIWILLQGVSFCKEMPLGRASYLLPFSIYTANSCFEWLENLKQLQRRCTCMYMPGSCVACNMLHLDTPHIWMLVFDHFAVPVMTAKHFLGLCYLKKPFARLQNILLQGTVQTFCKGKPFTRQGPFARGHPFARVTFCKAIHEESLGEGVLNPFTRAAFWEGTL